MNVELRHLRYFLAVAETGSLSAAAAKLFVAQPPLSVQIRQLEEALGAPLFVRHPRGVHLTAAGQALLPEARFLAERARRLRDAVHGAAGRSRLALGFVPSAGSTVLPELARRLKTLHPALDLDLHEMISAEQVEALVGGRIDAGLVRAAVKHRQVVTPCWVADPFCLALPAGEARGRAAGPLDLKDFAGHDFVGFTRHRGPAYFDQSIQVCAQAGFSPRIRYEASTVHGVLDLVAAGLGVGLVPESTALMERKGVRLRPLARKAAAQERLGLVRRRSDAQPLLPAVEAAVGEALQALRRRASKLLAR